MLPPDDPSRARIGGEGRWRGRFALEWPHKILLIVGAIFLAVVAIVSAVALAIRAPQTEVCPLTQTLDEAAVFATSAPLPPHIIEQYKAFLADLAAFGAQLASTQTFYLTIVSALIAVLAFKETIRPLRDYVAPASILVFLFIAAVCAVWSITAIQFARVIRAKFEVIRLFEKQYPALFPLYTYQTDFFFCIVPGWMRSIIGSQFVLVMIIGGFAFAISLVGAAIQIRGMMRAPKSARAETVTEPWLPPPQ